MNNCSWKEKWVEDINLLQRTLQDRHKNLFFNINKESFEDSIENIKNMVDSLEYNDMKVEISRVVASVGDAHTTVKLPMKYVLPIEIYWFNEGLYVVETLNEHSKIQYLKIIEINNIKIEDVISELTEIISHENKAYLKSHVPKYIQAIELLYGLMIADNVESCIIKFENLEGEIITEKINSIDIGKYNELKKQENNNMRIKENKNCIQKPMYMKKNNENYWFEYLNDKKILYIKYNLCRESEEQSVEVFINSLTEFINKNNVKKLVIDLRNNTGGDSRLLEPFIEYVKNNKDININGNLFVIIGRETFSSALLNAFDFKNNTNAILIGEPTGGKPNCYGEIEKFTLPNSKFIITYSTEYYKLIDDDECESLLPDINIEIGINDFINRKDSILEYIKAFEVD